MKILGFRQGTLLNKLYQSNTYIFDMLSGGHCYFLWVKRRVQRKHGSWEDLAFSQSPPPNNFHSVPKHCQFLRWNVSHTAWVVLFSSSLDFLLMSFEFLRAVVSSSVCAAMMLAVNANYTVCLILNKSAAVSLNCFTSCAPTVSFTRETTNPGAACCVCIAIAHGFKNGHLFK